MAHYFRDGSSPEQKLSPEQMVWFLSPCIGAKEADSFSAWLNRQSSLDSSSKYNDLKSKAKTLLDAYTLSAALSATSAGLTPSQGSPSQSVRRKKTATQLQAENSMAKENSFNVTNLSDAMPEQTINDIKQHSNTTDAVKAYLLEVLQLPPREGEFQDIIYLKSPPGYGKTSYIRGIVQEVNRKLGSDKFELVEITLSNFAPAEVTGLSFPEDNSKKKKLPATGANPEPLDNELSDGKGVRSPGNETLPRYNVVNTWTPITRQVHDILSRKRIPVIFIDEMSNVTQQWEAIILKFAEGKIGSSWKIRGPLRFIAAGNPPSDSRAGREFSEPLKHRLYEIRYRPSFLDYERLANSVDNPLERFALQTVCNYLKLYPDHFVPPPGELSYRNRSLCPRNWTLAASHYAQLLQRTAREMKLDPSKLDPSKVDQSTIDRTIRTIRVPSEHLRYRLVPLLPPDALDGFVTYASLQDLILGDEIICKGKSIENENLTLEQLRIVTRSVCVTISQHVSELYPQFQRRQQLPLLNVTSQMEMKKMQEEEKKKQEEIKTKLRTYVSNFASFVQEVQKHPKCSVELDSLFMPSMEDLKPVMNMFIRDKKQIFTSKEEGLSLALQKLFYHIYKTLDPSSSPTSSPPPQTTKFLTTSNSSQPAAPSSPSSSSNPTSSPDMHANMHYRHRHSPGLQ
jgi:MoxR-like ATPase